MAAKRKGTTKTVMTKAERVRIERLRRETLSELSEASRHLGELGKVTFQLSALYTQTNILPWVRKEVHRGSIEVQKLSRQAARKLKELKRSVSKKSRSSSG